MLSLRSILITKIFAENTELTTYSTLIIGFHGIKFSPTVSDEVPFNFYSVHFLVLNSGYLFTQPLPCSMPWKWLIQDGEG